MKSVTLLSKLYDLGITPSRGLMPGFKTIATFRQQGNPQRL